MIGESSWSSGVGLLPDAPGIYCILNRVNGKRWVGLASRSLRRRGQQQEQGLRAARGDDPIARDARAQGQQAFMFFALEIRPDMIGVSSRAVLRERELWWAQQLLALDEQCGYNREAGGVRSMSSRFRDHERKLMGARSRRYQLLPQVNLFDPIAPALLQSWVRASTAARSRP